MSYFDHSATTPIHPLVMEKMNSTSEAHFGNPSSVHTSGRKAKSIIESSRRMIAESLHASSNEIVFTGSGTEANNSVLLSLIYEKNKHPFLSWAGVESSLRTQRCTQQVPSSEAHEPACALVKGEALVRT